MKSPKTRQTWHYIFEKIRLQTRNINGLQAPDPRSLFKSGEEWSRRDLSAMDAAANVAQIKMMISESNTWRDIQKNAPKEKRSKTIQTAAENG